MITNTAEQSVSSSGRRVRNLSTGPQRDTKPSTARSQPPTPRVRPSCRLHVGRMPRPPFSLQAAPLPASPSLPLPPSPPLPLPLCPAAHRPDLVLSLALWMRRLWWCFSSSYHTFGISRSTLSCILPTVMCHPPVAAPTPLHFHRILLVARRWHRGVSVPLSARDVTFFL